ncbi:hypothetical protein FDECE_13387 [Fusarium decemcellulare]|nr:hypothetical protein FDECE_13387 [Fusarium decemcellulare]
MCERISEGVRAKSEQGGAELPRRGRFGDSADNDAVRSLGLDPSGGPGRPGINRKLQGRRRVQQLWIRAQSSVGSPHLAIGGRVRKGRVSWRGLTQYVAGRRMREDAVRIQTMSVSLEVSKGLDPNDRQRGTTHQPGPGQSHESRHEHDSSTPTLRELFVPFALLAQLAPSPADSVTETLSW